jgi:ABC-type bacteriocin/lantibiotic exporter with double-glycine peptidase domain
MTPVILPVPHVQQHEYGECLAACAAMVLGYFGVTVAYRRLLKLLQIEPDLGTPAYNIRRLEQIGFTVGYQQGVLAELHDHLTNNHPCIAMVNTQELPYWSEAVQHAVVVVGLDANDIYLNDPAFSNSPFQVSHGDFELAWLEQDEFYAVVSPRG